MVTGIAHIFDSVVLTGLRFDSGLLGSQIAAFCSGVNDNDEDDDDVLLAWHCGILTFPVSVNAFSKTMVATRIKLIDITFNDIFFSYHRLLILLPAYDIDKSFFILITFFPYCQIANQFSIQKGYIKISDAVIIHHLQFLQSTLYKLLVQDKSYMHIIRVTETNFMLKYHEY